MKLFWHFHSYPDGKEFRHTHGGFDAPHDHGGWKPDATDGREPWEDIVPIRPDPGIDAAGTPLTEWGRRRAARREAQRRPTR